jgi:PPOX class probable F420-dependent enzyme
MDDLDRAREFLRHSHRAVLITYRRDGGLQSSPVAATVDAEGRVVISTRTHLAKAANARRDPRVSLCAVADNWYGPWLHVDGECRVVDLPEAMEGLVDCYRRIAGEHPNWDEYRAAMTTDRRVLLQITPTSAAGPAAVPPTD